MNSDDTIKELRDLKRENELLTLMLSKAQEEVLTLRENAAKSTEVENKVSPPVTQEAPSPQKAKNKANTHEANTHEAKDKVNIHEAKDDDGTSAQAPFYAPFGNWIMVRFPKLFSLLKFVRHLTVGILRRRWAVSFAALLILIVILGFVSADSRYILWGGVLIVIILFSIFYIGVRVYYIGVTPGGAVEGRFNHLENEERFGRLEKQIGSLRKEMRASSQALEEKLKTSSEALETATNITLMDYVDPLQKDFDYFRKQMLSRIEQIEDGRNED